MTQPRNPAGSPLPFTGPPPDRDVYVEGQPAEFDPGKWKAALRQYDERWWPAALDECGGCINRGQVRQFAAQADDPVGAAHLFIATAVWGSGNKRISFRTNACSAPLDVVGSHLLQAVEQSRGSDPVGLYRKMIPGGELYIKGIGPSFFTKFLYFATYDPGRTQQQPLIFDLRVRTALSRLCGLKLGREPDDYGTYLAVIDAWATAWRTPTDVVERALFAIGYTSQFAIDILRGLPPGKSPNMCAAAGES